MKATCPTCGEPLEELTGDQPEGSMEVYLLDVTLPGFDDTIKTYMIEYTFPDGIQGVSITIIYFNYSRGFSLDMAAVTVCSLNY